MNHFGIITRTNLFGTHKIVISIGLRFSIVHAFVLNCAPPMLCIMASYNIPMSALLETWGHLT